MSIKKNLVFNIILSVSNIIFPIITFPYASRVLGPSGIGKVNFVMAFCQYFVLIAALGIPIYGIREIAKVKDDSVLRSKVFYEIFIIRLLTTVLTLIPYFLIILYFDKLQQYRALFYWGVLFIISNITSIEWFFTGLENFKYITSRSIVVKLLSVIALFIFVKTESDTVNYFLVTTSVLLMNGLINLRYSAKFLNKFSFKNNLRYRTHLKPLVYIFSSLLAMNVYTLMDTILLGLMSTDKSVGYYNAVTRLIKISLTVITSLSTVLLPRLSFALSQNNETEIKALISKSISFVYTLGIPMMMLIFVLAPELIRIFSGEDFLPAVVTLRIITPLILIIGMASIFSQQILTAVFSQDKSVMLVSVLGAIVSVILNFCLIPYLNENGSAISNVVTELIVTAACYYMSRKLLDFNLHLKQAAGIFLSTLPYFIIAFLIKLVSHNFMVIIATTSGFAFLFFITFNIFIVKNDIIVKLAQKALNFKMNLKQ